MSVERGWREIAKPRNIAVLAVPVLTIIAGCTSEPQGSPGAPTTAPAEAAPPTTITPWSPETATTVTPAETTAPPTTEAPLDVANPACVVQIDAGGNVFKAYVEAKGVEPTDAELAAIGEHNKGNVPDFNRVEEGDLIDICVDANDDIKGGAYVAPTTTIPPTTLPPACNTQTFSQATEGANDCVVQLQTHMNNLGCNAGPADGIFGAQTGLSVLMFQSENGLVTDAKFGPQSWQKIESGTSAPCQQGDIDAYDRLACLLPARCLLVHIDATTGQNVIEGFENGAQIGTAIVNTGKPGFRTRNTLTASIFNETFPSDADEMTTIADAGVDPKSWAPGVRQIYDGDTGLMGDAHSFDRGEAFHWRVAYTGAHDENGKSTPVIGADGLAQENADYNGGYESHGCVHVPKLFLDIYDDTLFQIGTEVRVQDQPVD